MIKLRDTTEGVLIPIVAQPRSKRTLILGFHAGQLKIAVCQPLQAGRANEAILELLAEELGIPLRSLKLISGAMYRRKLVLVEGGEIDQIRELLEKAVAN
jgi:uncharacterized protein